MINLSLNKKVLIIDSDPQGNASTGLGLNKTVLKNNKNSLNADVVEVNIETKDLKIFMYEEDKKVNFKNLN